MSKLRKILLGSFLCTSAAFFINYSLNSDSQFSENLEGNGVIAKILVQKPVSQNSAMVKNLSVLIKKDRLCEIYSTRYGSNPIFLNQYSIKHYFALSAANNKPINKCSAALFANDRITALAYSQQGETPPCLFSQALILANLLEGFPDSASFHAPQAQLELAKELLLRLHRRDPQNGIYGFFLMSVLEDLHGSQAEIDALFQDFLQAAHFDNPLIRVGVDLIAFGKLNPTAYATACELTSMIHVPRYSIALHVIKRIALSSNLGNELELWANNFIQRIDLARMNGMSDPYIWLIELAIQRSFADAVWMKQRPNEQLPNNISQAGFLAFRSELIKKSLASYPSLLSFDVKIHCDGYEKYIHKNFASILHNENLRQNQWNSLHLKAFE